MKRQKMKRILVSVLAGLMAVLLLLPTIANILIR